MFDPEKMSDEELLNLLIRRWFWVGVLTCIAVEIVVGIIVYGVVTGGQ